MIERYYNCNTEKSFWTQPLGSGDIGMQAAWLVFSGQEDDTVVLYSGRRAVCLSLSLSQLMDDGFKRSKGGR